MIGSSCARLGATKPNVAAANTTASMFRFMLLPRRLAGPHGPALVSIAFRRGEADFRTGNSCGQRSDGENLDFDLIRTMIGIKRRERRINVSSSVTLVARAAPTQSPADRRQTMTFLEFVPMLGTGTRKHGRPISEFGTLPAALDRLCLRRRMDVSIEPRPRGTSASVLPGVSPGLWDIGERDAKTRRSRQWVNCD